MNREKKRLKREIQESTVLSLLGHFLVYCSLAVVNSAIFLSFVLPSQSMTTFASSFGFLKLPFGSFDYFFFLLNNWLFWDCNCIHVPSKFSNIHSEPDGGVLQPPLSQSFIYNFITIFKFKKGWIHVYSLEFVLNVYFILWNLRPHTKLFKFVKMP